MMCHVLHPQLLACKTAHSQVSLHHVTAVILLVCPVATVACISVVMDSVLMVLRAMASLTAKMKVMNMLSAVRETLLNLVK